jgi:hypothetical protein
MLIVHSKRRVRVLLLTAAMVPGCGLISSFFQRPGIVQAEDSQWIRPTKPGDPLLWGRKDGVVFGLPSEGGLPGPRGLIRVGVISAHSGRPELLNFIAVEPVVAGRGNRGDRMAFSELEPSEMDPGSVGKRLWLGPGDSGPPGGTLSVLSNPPAATERLTVRIEVERFKANGAHVFLVASMDSNHPNEIQMAVSAYDDGPRIEELSLSATMGNYERLRWLWLKDRRVDSRQLYRGYRGEDFAERETYPLPAMLRNFSGDAIVFCTPSEADPQKNPDFTAADHWRYRLGRFTQYWRVPAAEVQPNLRVRVNGRRVYWNSQAPVGGGIAFENFEVRQTYQPGQVFVFGIAAQEPWEMQPPIQHLAHARKLEAN